MPVQGEKNLVGFPNQLVSADDPVVDDVESANNKNSIKEYYELYPLYTPSNMDSIWREHKLKKRLDSKSRIFFIYDLFVIDVTFYRCQHPNEENGCRAYTSPQYRELLLSFDRIN